MTAKCVVCGKPLKVPEQTKVCSMDCRRLHMFRSGKRPPAKLPANTTTYDINKVYQSTDNSAQVALFDSILDSLDIKYVHNFQLQNYTYDIALTDNKVLICADTTATSNIYTLKHEPTLQRNRALLAKIFGYRCIHIYDWDDPIKILSSLIPKIKLYARNCTVQEISPDIASLFYNMYHYEGEYPLGFHYGLFHNDDLVECMSFAKPASTKYQYKLCRFCTAFEYQVLGGLSKLFHAFVQDYSPSSIVAFCDCNKFIGDCYEKFGMTRVELNAPYKIWSKGIEKREHAFLSYKSKVAEFDDMITSERSLEQIMLEHGWSLLYDCGRSKYEWRSPCI